jgi:hypothetical protein
MPLDVFETDWQRQWLVERGVEIISEASRHLTDELKAHHPEIPWQKVAGIGKVLRHNYESIVAPVIWKLAQADLTSQKVGGTGNRACPQTARLTVTIMSARPDAKNLSHSRDHLF